MHEPNDRLPVDHVSFQERPVPVDDALGTAPEEPQNEVAQPSANLRNLVEWAGVIVAALAAALFVQAYLVQAFEIPSGSMQETLDVGDRILVNKLSYRLGEVSRGDLVVFDRLEGTPGNTDQLIKRAIALPGETLELRDDGSLWIWGPGETVDEAQRLDEPYLAANNRSAAVDVAGLTAATDLWHDTCVNVPRDPGRCTLDDRSYFMLGDNRQRSTDSRAFGPVPEENVVGRAFARIWPGDSLGGL